MHIIYTRPLTTSFLIGSELAPADTYIPYIRLVPSTCSATAKKKKKKKFS